MGDALTVTTVANSDHFKDQNTHFAHWSTVLMLSGDILYSLTKEKVDKDLLKYILDLKVGFLNG